MHKIYIDTNLSFTTIKNSEIHYKKLKWDYDSTWWNPVFTKNAKKISHVWGQVPIISSYSGGWGRRIPWTQEAEVAVSWDCAIALQPGWQSKTVSKRK